MTKHVISLSSPPTANCQLPTVRDFDIIVIGGGHAGAEAAWAASRLGARVALVSMDPARIGQMSCNPAIGGLAKGQMVREIDALGGLMGLATDATGIQFRMLNRSKGPAVWGPRAQADKYKYAVEVQRLLGTCPGLEIVRGEVAEIETEAAGAAGRRVTGVRLADGTHLKCRAAIVTTGTFLRALMHTGERKTEGGRVGEQSATGLSGCLARLGLEMGRLKTGTPPRLQRETIDFAAFELQPGDEEPLPFSYMNEGDLRLPICDLRLEEGGKAVESQISNLKSQIPNLKSQIPNLKSQIPNLKSQIPNLKSQISNLKSEIPNLKSEISKSQIANRKSQIHWSPPLPQICCYLSATNARIHELIRANLHRAPMYSGQIASTGPRYCPSIEDKVVRFAEKESHHIFLEPEGLDTDEIYCNGISTSLPADVQEAIVRLVPGLENAKILRYGYAVEYDMVWPTQIRSTLETKKVEGLFLAGQINGTSGYEEAAAQGLMAGVNAARKIGGKQDDFVLRRDQAYIGVLIDDLVTKPPTEPYRMFTSRAEHRLHLRNDNADARLTPLGRELGLVDDDRWTHFTAQRDAVSTGLAALREWRVDGIPASDWLRRSETDWAALVARLPAAAEISPGIGRRIEIALKYEGYIARQDRQIERFAQMENKLIPTWVNYETVVGLRNEARQKLGKFTPRSLGQALRISGITPADVAVLAIHMDKPRR